MCTDLRDFWYATLQVNINHTGSGKFIMSPGDVMLMSMKSCHSQSIYILRCCLFTDEDKHFIEILSKEDITAA